MNAQTAVEFPTATRVHIAIVVRDVEGSLPFYRTLFGQDPTKVKEGYAKFEVQDPPVNFTLNQDRKATGPSDGTQHYGIQVKSTAAVVSAKQRLETAGLSTMTEDNVTCCYAVQDKVWAIDPDGHRWEVFVVTDADSPVHSDKRKVEASESDKAPCCTPSCCK